MMKEEIEKKLNDTKKEINEIKDRINDYRTEIEYNRSRVREFLKGDSMNITAIIGLLGLLTGGIGTGITMHKLHQKKLAALIAAQPKEQIAEKQIEVQLQLTDLDLLKIPCSDAYIQKHESDLLCRELFCLMQTRGIDSQTAGSSCEEISNISNTIEILEQCADATDQEQCYRLFRERK